MAKSKLELAVETGSWEGGLKKAGKSLDAFIDSTGSLGNALKKNEHDMTKFVQMMGEMTTKSTNPRMALRELTNTILDLQGKYNSLSDAEKSSNFGKAMLSSIDQLKKRAGGLKDQIADLDEEIKHLASDTAITDGINMITRTVGSCATAMAAWSGDSKEVQEVLRDIAKIQSTVAAIEAVTKAFQEQNLVMLCNPWVATAAAIAAVTIALYELCDASDTTQDLIDDINKKCGDEVGEFEALNRIVHTNTIGYEERNKALEKLKELVPDYHADLTREGELLNDNTIALDNYRESMIRAATMEAMKDAIKEEVKAIGEKNVKLKQAEERYNKLCESGAGFTQMAIDLKREMNSLQSDIDDHKEKINEITGSWDDATTAANNYSEAASEAALKLIPGAGVGASIIGVDTNTGGAGSLASGLMGVVTPRKKPTGGSGGHTSRRGHTTSGGTKSASGMSDIEDMSGLGLDLTSSIYELNEAISYFKRESSKVTNEDAKNYIDGMIESLQARLDAQPLALRLGVSEESIAAIEEKMKSSMMDISKLEPLPVEVDPMAEVSKTSNDTAAAWSAATKAISNAGSAMQNLDDPSAKVAGIVMQAIANVALGFAQASASPATGAAGVFGWIAAATAGIATMTATIAQIKSATKMAEGGVIGGSSFVGDKVPILANSGETVLSAAATSNLAANLSNNNAPSSAQTTISGEQIVSVVNAYGRRIGKGEFLR